MTTEEFFEHIWTSVNICTTAASDSYRDLGKQWRSLVHLYDYLLDLGDPRVANWPLMASPWPTCMIVMAYLYLVSTGPKLMEARKPFELRPLILIYNAAVAGLNLHIGVELFLLSRQLDFNWTCEPVDYSLNPLAVRVASALW